MQSITGTDIGFILGILGIISIIFTVYRSFAKPTEELETNLALSKKDIDNKATVLAQTEMANKAALLEQQVKLAYEANEKKFQEMGMRIDNVVAKVDNLVSASTVWHLDISNAMTKLQTILEERLPHK